MENDNQRIIFDTPGDATPTEIILDILKKNGVEDAVEDLVRSPENSKLFFLSNAIKDFFDKKLSEKNLISALQNRLKIKEANATSLLKDIKEKIIPFAKKINFGDEKTEEKISTTPQKPIEKSPLKIPAEKIIVKKSKPIKNILEQEKPEIKKTSTAGPDNYREPIG